MLFSKTLIISFAFFLERCKSFQRLETVDLYLVHLEGVWIRSDSNICGVEFKSFQASDGAVYLEGEAVTLVLFQDWNALVDLLGLIRSVSFFKVSPSISSDYLKSEMRTHQRILCDFIIK